MKIIYSMTFANLFSAMNLFSFFPRAQKKKLELLKGGETSRSVLNETTLSLLCDEMQNFERAKFFFFFFFAFVGWCAQ